jgi:glycosyltransferase involved in cell wall biosynthesis
VILPTKDRDGLLQRQLEALVEQTYTGPWELIVADNGSRDGTLELLETFSSRLPLRVVLAGERVGAAYARNRGAAAAVGDYLLFVDDDDEVAPHWLSAMAAAARHASVIHGSEHPFVSAADGTATARGPGTDGLHCPFGFLPSLSSANSGLRADLFRRLGGFNERYRRLEDTELFWRAQMVEGEGEFVSDGILASRLRSGPRAVWLQAYTDGKAVPMLFRDFRAFGMPRTRPWDETKSLLRIMAWSRNWVRTPAGREEIAREFGSRAGRIVGSIRERVLYL